MFWHPLSLAILSIQAVMSVLFLAAGTAALRVVLRWRPQSADSRQLALEAVAEAAAVQGRWAYGLLLASAFLLLFGISNVFHETIPGAMCGTGVFQAMAGAGPQLLLVMGVLVVLVRFWCEMDRLNRGHTEMPLTKTNARIFLLIPPVVVLTLLQTVQSFTNIQPYRPVDCCAVVYDRFTTLHQAQSVAGVTDRWWIVAWAVLSLLLVGLGITAGFGSNRSKKIRDLLAAVSLAWVPIAAVCLVDILSAYHYGVLHHHCPWCLFLSGHRWVGYPLYGAMALIGMEGLTVFILPRAVSEHADLMHQALARCRTAGRRIVVSAAVFFVFAAVPPLVWRLRYGVWMGG